MSEPIKTIDQGCPVCGSDLRGSRLAKYFCKACNLLFSEETLRRAEIIKEEFPNPIIIPPAGIVQPKEHFKFVASSSSKRLHLTSCKQAEKIDPGKKIFFQEFEEAKGYALCKRCLQPK